MIKICDLNMVELSFCFRVIILSRYYRHRDTKDVKFIYLVSTEKTQQFYSTNSSKA